MMVDSFYDDGALTVRVSSEADIPIVEGLLVQSGLPVVGWRDWWLSTVVGWFEGEIVGCAALELYAEGALLRSVAVAEGYRGRGWGEALVGAALEMGRWRGVTAVYLLTETAVHFFPRFGFEKIEREEVPLTVRQSIEFTEACPTTADVMRKVY
ncbi:MAG TPA: arsenic resistance N-acetyltransferase ArsN2 [Anaerolineae bacterium]|nr:arsenic resistance N-acetyltransferase ArsN2 [Anaerolineae bacterium]